MTPIQNKVCTYLITLTLLHTHWFKQNITPCVCASASVVTLKSPLQVPEDTRGSDYSPFYMFTLYQMQVPVWLRCREPCTTRQMTPIQNKVCTHLRNMQIQQRLACLLLFPKAPGIEHKRSCKPCFEGRNFTLSRVYSDSPFIHIGFDV